MKMLRWLPLVLLFIPLVAQAEDVCVRADTTCDVYGGIITHKTVSMACDGGMTGVFYVEKRASDGRWHMCTPLGNWFQWQGLFVLHHNDTAAMTTKAVAKYGDSDGSFCDEAIEIWKEWGGTAIDNFWHNKCLPVGTNFGAPAVSSANKLPFQTQVRTPTKSVDTTLCSGVTSPGSLPWSAGEQVKDIWRGLDPAVAGISTFGSMPDAYDAKFRDCAFGLTVDGFDEFTDAPNQTRTIATPSTGAVRTSNVVTITTTAVHDRSVDDVIRIAGVTDSSFNGTFLIATVPTTTTFTYAQVLGDATSGNGTTTWDEPWLAMVNTDESDAMSGFGPGWDLAGSNGTVHLDIGWNVWAICPTMVSNAQGCGSGGSITYTDQEVHTKTDWIAWIKTQYATIALLNTAWSTSYTSFDADGGWGTGTGLADENGDGFTTSNCQEDLACMDVDHAADLRLYTRRFTTKIINDMYDGIVDKYPNHLVAGPQPIGGWEGAARDEVLQGAGDSNLDLLMISMDPDRPTVIQRAYEKSGLPAIAWMGYNAQEDSSFTGNPPPSTEANFATQELRGARVKSAQTVMLTTSQGGVFPMMGWSNWQFAGKNNESTNWGFMTQLLNQFNGIDSVTGSVTCTAPDDSLINCGGEAANYGDMKGNLTNGRFVDAGNDWLEFLITGGVNLLGGVRTSGKVVIP